MGMLLKQFLRCWRYYVPIGIVCLIGAIIYLLVVSPKYEFIARMQLVARENGMMSQLSMLKASGIGALLGGGSSSGISTGDEVIVLRSRTNLAEAIRQTGYQLETREHRGLKRVLLYGPEEMPVTYLFPESFLDTISEKIKVKASLNGGKLTAKVSSDLFSTVTVENQSLPCRVQLPVGDIVIADNPSNANPGDVSFTTRISPLQSVFEDLHKDVYADTEETVSDIVLLSCEDESKKRGCALLNTMMSVYNQYSMKIKVYEAGQNARFVRGKLDTITRELAYLEHGIEAFQKSHKIPEPELYAEVTMRGYQDMETTILDTEAKLKMLEYVVEYMADPDNKFASIPAIEGVSTEAIAMYNKLVLERQRLLLTTEKGNPSLTLAEKQLEDQHKMLAESIDAARKSLRASLDEILNRNNTLMAQLNALPTQAREYIEMKRQQKLKEKVYLFLMQKLQESELANSPDEQSARVLDPAFVSAKPISPRKVVVLGIAFVVACVLSVIAVYVDKRRAFK